MKNQKVVTALQRIGIFSSIAFPAILIFSFFIHHIGEFTMADLFTLKFRYIQPTPERFMELFRSESAIDFIIPHLIIYLALPLVIPAVAYLGSLLFKNKPWLSIIGVSVSLIGIVFMGGVFGSWLSFIAIGNVSSDLVAGAIPFIEAVTRNNGLLMLTSSLAALSLIGFMIITAGLFFTRSIARWQSVLIFLGNLIIITFMDIDNLMLVGSLMWLLGILPFLKKQKSQPE